MGTYPIEELNNEEFFATYGQSIYNHWGERKVIDKRKYTDILRDLDAKMAEYNITVEYIKNHLGNIDSHMGKINDTNLKQEVKIARNKDRIGLGYKIGGGLFSILSLALVALVLRLLGVY